MMSLKLNRFWAEPLDQHRGPVHHDVAEGVPGVAAVKEQGMQGVVDGDAVGADDGLAVAAGERGPAGNGDVVYAEDAGDGVVDAPQPGLMPGLARDFGGGDGGHVGEQQAVEAETEADGEAQEDEEGEQKRGAHQPARSRESRGARGGPVVCKSGRFRMVSGLDAPAPPPPAFAFRRQTAPSAAPLLSRPETCR